MKKIQITATAIALMLAATFLVLWIHEKNNQTDTMLLCQSSASAATARFVEYKETGDESYYWAAISEFRAFQRAYWLLVEDTNKSSNYTFLNEVYTSLIFESEASRKHIEEIISVMSIIANDINDPSGFSRMADLRNNIRE